MLTHSFEIKRVEFNEAKAVIHVIRHTVFVIEQGISPALEFDDEDKKAFHVLAFVNGSAVGSGRISRKGKIGRMAVLRDYRRSSIGAKLLIELLEIAADLNLAGVYLSSQVHAVAFYEKFGFICEGDYYLEAGIRHRLMRKSC